MRIPKLLALCLCVMVVSQAGADPKSDAEAAMALAKAKVIVLRDEPKNAARTECYTDLTAAKAESARVGKQLVLWVGMTCEAIPEIRDGLAACVHCHVDSYNGSASPRLCLPVEGGAWCFPRSQLGTDYDASSVRAVIGKPIPRQQAQPIQSAPSIVLPVQFGPRQDCPDGNCPLVPRGKK